MAEQPTFLDRVRDLYTKGVEKTLDVSFTDEHWPHTVKLADRLEGWLAARPPQRILDLACGTGAPTVAMALKGYEVTGLDLTPAMLDIARKGAEAKGARVEWLCQDMREITYVEAFDHVLLRDVIFGIFETKQEDADLVHRIAAALKPGGRCLFEVYNKQFAKSHGVEGKFFYNERLDTFVPREPTSAFSSMRLYSLEEWERMLAENGLRIVKTDGWKWKQDPDPPPWRADIIVAQNRAVL